MFNCFFDSAARLDWDNPVQAINVLTSQNWIENTLKDGVVAVFGGEQTVSSYAEQISAAINSTTSELLTGFFLFLLFSVIGIICGYFILKFQIRKKIASRAFWKTFLAAFVDFILVSALTALSVWLASLWKFSLVFSFIISVLIVGGVELAEAYVVQGFGKIGFKEVFTVKNIFLLVLTNFIIFIIWGAITAIITYLINQLVGIVIGLVLLEITVIVTNLNAEAYVKDYAENKKQP